MNESIIIILSMFFSYMLSFHVQNRMTKIKSTVNGTEYYVHDFEDNLKAANILGRIHNNIILLIKHCIAKNDSEYKPYVNQLKMNFSRTQLLENSDLFPENNLTSYSLNKGDKIVFCLRDPYTYKLEKFNTIMYVALHEISHVACPEVGHTPLFKKIFKYFIIEAANINIYKLENYIKDPADYCGIQINEKLV